LGNIFTGTTPSTSNEEYYGNEYMFVSPADISDDVYVYETEKHLSLSGLNVSRKLPVNSVMVVCIGSTIGKVALTTKECSTNQQINSIVCNKDNDPKFVYYLMKSLESTIKRFAGATAVPILNKQDFSKIKVAIPPLPEQMEISSVMEKFEKTIDSIKAKLLTSQKLKKQILESSLG
jgi:type I restriction enzyme S subunit